ncbi:MAG: phage shock protein PspC [Frankiales bacterium]|nr:phage shock protein PspC [Frankiales bacterium]
MTSTASPSASPSTVPPAPRPPLRRSSTDRMLGGVCGGLAEYSGLDPVLWRVAMVALTLLGPGVIVYLLLWVLMPTGPAGPQGTLDRLADRVRGEMSARRSDSAGS